MSTRIIFNSFDRIENASQLGVIDQNIQFQDYQENSRILISQINYLEALRIQDSKNDYFFNSQYFLPHTLVLMKQQFLNIRRTFDFQTEDQIRGIWVEKGFDLNSNKNVTFVKNASCFNNNFILEIQKLVENRTLINLEEYQIVVSISYNIILNTTNIQKQKFEVIINQIYGYNEEQKKIINISDLFKNQTLFNRLQAISTYAMISLLNNQIFIRYTVQPTILELELIQDQFLNLYLIDMRIINRNDSDSFFNQNQQGILKMNKLLLSNEINFLSEFTDQSFQIAPYNYLFKRRLAFVAKEKNLQTIYFHLQNLGWNVLQGFENQQFMYQADLIYKKTVEHSKLRYGQMMHSYIQNSEQITNKDTMLQLLQTFDSFNYFNFSSESFLPQQIIFTFYNSTFTSQEENFIKQEKQLYENNVQKKLNQKIYIWKPSAGWGGFSIRVFHDINLMIDFIKEQKHQFQESSSSENKSQKTINNNNIINNNSSNNQKNIQTPQLFSAVVQELIKNPLLMDKKKIDFRFFVYIISADPMIIIFREGYLRKSLDEYDVENRDSKAHVTNVNQQQSNEKFSSDKDESIKTIEQFYEYFVDQHKIKTKEEILQVFHEIKKMLLYTVLAFHTKYHLNFQKGAFQIFGPDILIDQNWKPYLLEMNENVYMMNTTKGHSEVLPFVCQEIINMALYIFDQEKLGKEILISDYMNMCRNCTLLFDERNKYFFLKDYYKYSSG